MGKYYYVAIANSTHEYNINHQSTTLEVGNQIHKYIRYFSLGYSEPSAAGLPVFEDSTILPIFCEKMDNNDDKVVECITRKIYSTAPRYSQIQSPNLVLTPVKEVDVSAVANVLRSLKKINVDRYCAYLDALEKGIKYGYGVDVQNKNTRNNQIKKDTEFIRNFKNRFNK